MIDKKCIFITGAASGIGRETALFFGKKGWFVGITDVNEAGLTSLKDEIGADCVFTGVMDVADPDNVGDVMELFASQTGGKIDVLFNNAGIIKFGMFEGVDLSEHHRIIDINFKGILNCTHHAIKFLKNTPDSKIVNMASTSSIYGIPDFSVYSATKHAVIAMTEALNLELEPDNIFVCDILAPFVKTPLLDVPEEVFSIEKMGVDIEPIKIAETIWKAAHSRKLHWKIGTPTFLLMALFWALPFVKRAVVKSLTIRPA